MISIKRNIIKNIILTTLIALLLVIIALILYHNGYIEIIYHSIQGEKTEKNIIDEISINDVVLTYNEDNNIYYFPIAINDENTNQQLEIKIKSSKKIKSKIENKDFSTTINLHEKINYEKAIEINVESLLYKYKTSIKFTNLPIISLKYDEDQIQKREYIYSEFSITDPNYKENNAKYQFSSDSKIRYRGSFSFKYDKKSYRVKLDKNINFGLLGMTTTKTWILDSIATDISSLRPKTASDMWGNINEDVDPKKYTKLNSEYVEVYVNGKYNGIYLLKEVIDEDLLNLDKNTGVLIKGIDNSKIDFSNYHNVKADYITPFEIKYPKQVSKYPKAWVDILDKIKDYYTGNINYDIINKLFTLKI